MNDARTGFAALALLCSLGGALTACNFDLERMLDQKKAEPYEASRVFADGKVMRQPPLGTLPAGESAAPPEVVTGLDHGSYVARIPIEIDAALLERGEQRFQIFCRACHGPLGDGESPVSDAMSMRHPPSLYEPRIRALPVGAIYHTINAGYGLMPSYASQLGIEDRWAVVAYVQALQLSQSVRLAELPEELQVEAEPWLQ